MDWETDWMISTRCIPCSFKGEYKTPSIRLMRMAVQQVLTIYNTAVIFPQPDPPQKMLSSKPKFLSGAVGWVPFKMFSSGAVTRVIKPVS